MAAYPVLKPTLRPEDLATLTVAQYHRMIEEGILAEGEPIELVDGILWRRAEGEGMTIKPRHASTLDQLSIALAPRLAGSGCYLRLQNPLTLSVSDEPQPDAAIVVGRPGDFLASHPTAKQVVTVLEVAESSLERDRGLKLGAYARASIAQYVVLNLKNSVAEVYESPDPAAGTYRQVQLCHAGDDLRLSLPGGKVIAVPLAELLV